MAGIPGFARRYATNVVPILATLALLEILARTELINLILFPPPTEVVAHTVFLLIYGDLLLHIQASLRRLIVAFVVGGSIGVTTGLVMGWYREIRAVLNPYIALLYPIPSIALLPIMFSLFGVNEYSRVIMMSVAIFLLVSMNTLGGVLGLDRGYIEVALDNGASTFALFKDVIIPGTLSSIFTGLSLGFGLGFMLLVVIEMISAASGLGYVIWNSWQLFNIKRIYASLFIINVLGIVFIYGLDLLGDRLTPWEGS